jgi:hypothetical protein
MKDDIIDMVAEFDQFEYRNPSWTRSIRKLWAKLERHVASTKKKIRDCHPAFHPLLQIRFDKPMEGFEQLKECINDNCDSVGPICECDDC